MRFGRVKGGIRLEIMGTVPESFLNTCALNAVELWNMECVDACTLRVSAAAGELPRLEAIAQKCMCRLSVIERLGAEKHRAGIKRRWYLPLFMFAAAILLMVSSLFVWDIRVEGCSELSRAQVLRALEDCGVKEGCFWPGISSDMVRSRVIQKLPRIAWLSVNVNGSRARVTVRERQPKPEIYDESSPVNIVAAKTGIIRQMSVLNGMALAAPGDTVMQGDVLVSAYPAGLGGQPRQLRAKADVYADTWYELSAVSLPLPEKHSRGPGFGRLALKFGKNRINFYISSRKSVDECDKIIREYKIGVEGLFTLPITIVYESYRPYRHEGMCQPEGEMLRQSLYEGLMGQIQGSIEYSAFTEAAADGVSTVTLRAQCLENIAAEEFARAD